MKGLKKLTLATAIAAVPFAANADLKAMDDSAMGNVTGQAGVTIELEAKVDIKEVAYQDEGFLAISGLSIGNGTWTDADGDGQVTASEQGALSNVKLYIDVVGANGIGDSGAQAIGSDYLTAAAPNVGAVWDAGSVDNDATMPGVEDGDLVIGLRSVDGTPVQFGVGIDSVSLADSEQGDTQTGVGLGNLATHGGTTLISDLKIGGLLGPIDIVIQENQNQMNVNAYFNASGTLKADFVGTYLDFELHNRRGDDVNSLTLANGASTSFAHAQVDIGLATPASQAPGTPSEALAFNVNNFSGDLDLTNIRMGDAANPSIGSLYMTDLELDAQMTVYGH